MKKVVVTGATSMIGVALIRECLKNGCSVLALVREGTRRMTRLPVSDLLRVETVSLSALNSVKGDGGPYDTFYHLAWDYTIRSERDVPRLCQRNIPWSLDAVDLAKRLGCSRFIGAGSQAEYGPVSGIISEETKPEPVIAYGMAKLAACMLTRRQCEQYGMHHIWARAFSVYGVNDNSGTMINDTLDRLDRGETVHFTSGTQIWNYLHESDAGRLYYLLGALPVEDGLYCIAHPESIPLKEYIETLCEEYGGARCTFDPSDCGHAGLEVDMGKTLKATGFVPQVTFREGIREILKARAEARS